MTQKPNDHTNPSVPLPADVRKALPADLLERLSDNSFSSDDFNRLVQASRDAAVTRFGSARPEEHIVPVHLAQGSGKSERASESWTNRDASSPDPLTPLVLPAGFEFMLACFARKGLSEEVLGDAEAEYHKVVFRLGPRLARWWYRVYVLKVAAAMAPGALTRLWIFHKLLGI